MSIVSSGGIIDVTGPSVAPGLVIAAGSALNVSAGGITYDTSVLGSQTVAAGGLSYDDVISGGGVVTVSSGGIVGSSGLTYIVQSGGELVVSSGGMAFNTQVQKGGSAVILSGGTETVSNGFAVSVTVENGGYERVISGGKTSATAVSSGGYLSLTSGGAGFGTIITNGGLEIVSAGASEASSGATLITTVDSGGALMVNAGAAVVSAIVLSGGDLYLHGGTATGTLVSNGGVEKVSSGGVATGTIVLTGGLAYVTSGGSTTGTVLSGGTERLLAATAYGTTASAGGYLAVSSGGMASGTILSSGGFDIVSSGGTVSGTDVLSGAHEFVFTGGESDAATVIGAVVVSSGGLASGSMVGSGGRELISAGGTVDASSVERGGILVVSSGGTVSGGLVIDGGTAAIAGVVASGQTISLVGSRNVLSLSNPDDYAAPVSGFDATDKVYLGGFANGPGTVKTFSEAGDGLSGTVVFSSAGRTFDLTLLGDYTNGFMDPLLPTNFTLLQPPVPCYCAGTLILTETGEVAVESLIQGDRVITVSGHAKPVHWLGRRTYADRFLRGRANLLPVRIRAGALGEGLPRRDLLVSPCHAMFLDGLLVPASALINGSSIVQETGAQRVEYVHVELEQHDVIWAEGAPSETFVDDDSRNLFQNASEYTALYGETDAPARFFARRVTEGYQLEAIRRRLGRLIQATA